MVGFDGRGFSCYQIGRQRFEQASLRYMSRLLSNERSRVSVAYNISILKS